MLLHIPLHPSNERAREGKGRETWETYVNRLIATDLATTMSTLVPSPEAPQVEAAPTHAAPAPASPAIVEVAEPPVTVEPVEVAALPAAWVRPIEPGTQVDRRQTLDEFLRLAGATGPIVIGAGADLRGTATFVVESDVRAAQV